jgi:tetratricopeptide (TPR) repeat protein
VLVAANRDDEARAFLELVRPRIVEHFGEHNAIVANIDSNLAVIDGDHGDHAGALVRLQRVLAIDEEQLGPDNLVVAERLYSIAVTLDKLGRTAEALAAGKRAVAIFAAKSPGSSHHMFAKLMVAVAERPSNPATSLAVADEVLAAIPQTDPAARVTLAWTQLVRGHALLDLHRKPEARAAFAIARPLYAAENLPARVAEIDALDQRAR